MDTPTNADPPVVSSFEHRVGAVTTLLATYIIKSHDLNLATDEEMHNILVETLRQAREDILQQPAPSVPWPERLWTFWNNYLDGARAQQTLVSRLAFMCLAIIIDLPILLLFNTPQIRSAAMWSLKLFVRWSRCLRAHHELLRALAATIRAKAQQELPGLTDDEAEWIVIKITLLGWLASLMSLHGM